MNTRTIFLAGLCLLLPAGLSFSQARQKAQALREMKLSPPKPAMGITPTPENIVLIVKANIRNFNLSLTSTLGESVKAVRVGVWQMILSPGPQTIYFNAPGYKQVEQLYTTLQKNRSYEVEVSLKGKFPWLWVGLGTAAAGGGAYVALSGGGGTPPPLPVEKLPDPPGSPTGN